MKITAIIAAILLILLLVYVLFNYLSLRGVKTPEYKVIEKQNNIEIRQYSPMIVAQVTTSGSRQDAASEGFKQLANYIFGNNHIENSKAEKIKMTAPVIQQSTQKISMTAPVLQTQSHAGEWLVKFVMPKKYTLETLPKPNNKKIKIIEEPARKVIAIEFSGTSSPENLRDHQEQLEDYIVKHKISVTGDVEYAFYNPPWTLPMQRRNEIFIKIK